MGGEMEISVISAAEEPVVTRPLFAYSKRKRFLRCLKNTWYSMVPSKRKINLYVTQLFVLLSLSGALYGVLYKDIIPGTEAFALLLLALLSYIGGKVFGFFYLPPLLGMLIVGFLYRNLTFVKYYPDIGHKTISSIRDIALVIILLRAGLGLDGEKLKKLKMIVFRLTFVPCIVETACIAVFTHLLLDLPWIWGVMLGFIISAISPAVVLPILLNLTRRKFGVSKGIPTLIIAASSMDDILAITGFTISLSIAFSDGNLTLTLIKGPLEPLVGCAVGAVFGVIFWYLPSKERHQSFVIYYHVLLLCFGGISLMFLSKRAGIPGSGALGCISLAFVSALRWRNEEEQFHGVVSVYGVLWEILQPFMFSLIGAEIAFSTLKNHAGYGVLALFLGLCCRSVVTALVTCGTNLNIKEKIFICCAWLPKATVQAAVGSQALDYARLHNKGQRFEDYGKQVLNIAVLSIVMTAPLGAALTTLLGPLLLSKDDETAVLTEGGKSGAAAAETEAKEPVSFGACHQLQPSDILPGKNTV
ncbi:sodium/hydrogen exchanger 9B2-like [Uloborus diversus]|uniref:sodium/hydrogen exchanger 9B2-like n=1 Tax=Uloborus diversus TaxID=327109 RepID=UPI00240979DB|nr:sodium/hydrogen exchanger 9B2-like [Uloborus diversus]